MKPSTLPLRTSGYTVRGYLWNALLLFVLLTGAAPAAFAQTTSLPPYQQHATLPSFELQQVDNTVFSSSRLKKNIPTIIMFFSPTCEHCIHQFEDMMKKKEELKKYQIVMPTIQPKEELADFIEKYQLEKSPNIHLGIDTKYFFPTFYQIHNFPYLAFYDRHGKLISTFEGNLGVSEILKKFK